MSLVEQFPFADDGYSWWPIIQVVPKQGSHLKTILGVCWVAYCMVQIVIYEVYGKEVCMIGWTNRRVAYQPTQYLRAMVDEFAGEVQNELFSDAGSTMVKATQAGGVWQQPSSSGSSGSWVSSATSSAVSSIGASSSGMSSWNVVPSGLGPVREEDVL